MVLNANTGSVTVSLTYKSDLTPSQMLFSKNLSAGWNLLGITSITNPFSTIGNNPTMSVDFTRTPG